MGNNSKGWAKILLFSVSVLLGLGYGLADPSGPLALTAFAYLLMLVPIAFSDLRLASIAYVMYIFAHQLLIGLGFPAITDDLFLCLLTLGLLIRIVMSKAVILSPTLIPAYGTWVSYGICAAVMYGGVGGLWGLRDLLQFSVLLFIVPAVVQTKETLKEFVSVLLWGGFWVAILGIAGYIVHFLAGIEIPLLNVYTSPFGPTQYRAVGSVGNPNTLAYIVGTMVLLLIGTSKFPFLTRMKDETDPLRLALYIAVFTLALLVSFSRSGWIAIIPTVLLLALFLRRKGALIYMFTAVALALLASLAFIAPGVSSRIHSVFRYSTAPSLLRRLDTWTAMMQQACTNLMFGSGLGSYTRSTLAQRANIGTLDNYYVKTLVEQGVIGLVVLGFLFFSLYRLGWMLYRRLSDRELMNFLIGVMASLTYIILLGIPAQILDVFPVNALFWILAGLLVAMEGLGRREILAEGKG